jgi:hypothetical protein
MLKVTQKAKKPLAFFTCKAGYVLERLWVTVFFGFIASEVKLQERVYDFWSGSMVLFNEHGDDAGGHEVSHGPGEHRA